MQNIELLMETYPNFLGAVQSFTDPLLPEGERIETFFPSFYYRIGFARQLALKAKARRNEMPVIDDAPLEAFKQALADGGYSSWCDDCHVTPMQLRPYQCQIHVDKCLGNTIQHGKEETLGFLTSSPMFVDKNNMIIDGHHRWLTGFILDWELSVPAFRIRADINDLMPLLLSFSDKYNKRNL